MMPGDYCVDIPCKGCFKKPISDQDDDEAYWTNVGTFQDLPSAVAFLREHLGDEMVDDNGGVKCVIGGPPKQKHCVWISNYNKPFKYEFDTEAELNAFWKGISFSDTVEFDTQEAADQWWAQNK